MSLLLHSLVYVAPLLLPPQGRRSCGDRTMDLMNSYFSAEAAAMLEMAASSVTRLHRVEHYNVAQGIQH